MALDKTRLQDVSYRGFNVENLEEIESHLRQLLYALHKNKPADAVSHAGAVSSLGAALLDQCVRYQARNGGS